MADSTRPAQAEARSNAQSTIDKPGPPLWLLAELTYRCPLHCAFCYNPIGFDQVKDELGTDDWIKTLRQAREVGIGQCDI